MQCATLSSAPATQVAHVTGDVEYLQSADGRVSRGWAAAQVATTADFSHGSCFWTQFSGGLNYQARLASALHQEHLAALSLHSSLLWQHLSCHVAMPLHAQ